MADQPLHVVITGASGFVGQELAAAFAADGHRVSGIVRTVRADLIEAFPGALHAADLSEISCVETLAALGPVDLVIHCASQQPRKGMRYEDYHKGNVLTLDHVLDLCASWQCQKLIHFSSTAVYSPDAALPLTENTPTDPQSLYAVAKLNADHLLACRAKAEGLHALCFRLPSVFGIGHLGGLVHTYYEAAVQEQSLDIFSQGLLRRNVVHVDDVVQACRKAIPCLDTITGCELVLLGSQNALTMQEIGELIVRELDSDCVVRGVDQRATVEMHWDLLLTKAHDLLAYSPMSLEQGLQRYVAQRRGES